MAQFERSERVHREEKSPRSNDEILVALSEEIEVLRERGEYGRATEALCLIEDIMDRRPFTMEREPELYSRCKDVLIRALQSKDHWVAATACSIVGEVSDPDIRREFFEQMKTSDNIILRYGAASLRLNSAHEYGRLVELLKDQSFEVRLAALERSIEWDDPELRHFLVEAVEDPSEKVVSFAWKHLKENVETYVREFNRIICGRDQATSEEIWRGLTAKEPVTRCAALCLCSWQADAECAKALIAAANGITDRDEIEFAAEIVKRCPAEAIRTELLAGMASRVSEVVAVCAPALAGDLSDEARQVLMSCLDCQHLAHGVYSPALRALSSDKSPEATKAICDFLENVQNSTAEMLSARALAGRDVKRVQELLRKFWQSDDVLLRTERLKSLERSQENKSIFKWELECGTAKPFAAAAEALAEIGTEEEVRALLLHSKRGFDFNNGAADALAKANHLPAVLHVLLAGLKDPDEKLRSTCASTLALKPPPGALEALAEVMEDSVSHVRYCAVIAHKNSEDTLIHDKIFGLLPQADQYLQQRIFEALGKLGNPMHLRSFVDSRVSVPVHESYISAVSGAFNIDLLEHVLSKLESQEAQHSAPPLYVLKGILG